jgi:hypothetical protein
MILPCYDFWQIFNISAIQIFNISDIQNFMSDSEARLSGHGHLDGLGISDQVLHWHS